MTNNEPNCLIFEENSDVCKIYAQLSLTADYTCSQRTLIANCMVYDQNGDCEECSSTHYVYEDNANVTSCVLLEHEPLATDPNTINCLTYHFNVSVKCNKCKDNFYLDINNAGNNICVPNNQFYASSDNTVTNLLKISYKTTAGYFGNCNQFDYTLNRCI